MGVINTIAEWYKILKIIHKNNGATEEFQQRRLRRLLRYAFDHSEFYRALYQGIDLKSCSPRDLPIVTKTAMMDNYDRFVTDRRLKLHEIQKWTKDPQNVEKFYLGEFSPFFTSGSTGQNALITYHRKATETIQASLLANYPFKPERSVFDHIQKGAGFLFSKRPRVAVMTTPKGNVFQIFKRVSRLHCLFLNMKIFSYMDPLEQNVEELNKFQPDQLISAAFYIALLAQEQLAGRLHLAFHHPEAYIASCSEILTEHTRVLASKAWNMKINDLYGATECFHIATSCSASSCLHLMNYLCILEVVDGHNEPVPQGQYGEKILLTNLVNFVQPIIRYEIEDVTGFASQSCQCGSPLLTLLPLQGRTKDVFYFKRPQGGYKQIPPMGLQAALYNIYEVRQYQIVQTAQNELTCIYVPEEKAINIEPKLRQALQEVLAKRDLDQHVTLRLRHVEFIPRDARSGKYRPTISLDAPEGLDTA